MWIDSTKSRPLPFMEIVVRAGDLRQEPLTVLYWWADESVKGKGCFAYHNQDGSFARTEGGQASQGGKVACDRHGTRVPAKCL